MAFSLDLDRPGDGDTVANVLGPRGLRLEDHGVLGGHVISLVWSLLLLCTKNFTRIAGKKKRSSFYRQWLSDYVYRHLSVFRQQPKCFQMIIE